MDIAHASIRNLPVHVRARMAEVHARGDDPAARAKLRWHVGLIALSGAFSVLITFLTLTWLHWDCLIPVAPNWLQEFWDWIYKQ